ncbi:MAG TPA: Uma2 family endonuclease [Streptosporangiaceae bacterium]|nr:Uma2 family endonuclease [Streptosporangiaceae bacterium]
MSLPLMEHHGPWTVDDLRKLPEDEFHRYEIDDGVLIVSPRPSSPHQAASYRITRLLDDAIEAGGLDLAVVQEVDTITGRRGDWLKVPDVLVVTADAFDAEPQEYDVTDVVLAVEISASRQSRNRDFGEKLEAYAEVGIKDYWILELQPVPKLTAFALAGGSYKEIVASVSPVHLTRPFPVDVDPPQLIRRRG